MAEDTYAGDVSPSDAWGILRDDAAAVLIDCRTEPEWRYVGLPDLSALGKEVLCVCWQVFPDLRLNDGFAEAVAELGVTPERTVLFLCRSGVRSRNAAVALTAAGYRRCLNVADGFEGPHDRERRRGRIGGWKASGLPWSQE